MALVEFKEATTRDPGFADASIATVSCIGHIAYINRKDMARTQELFGQMSPLVRELRTKAPENPRFLWVLGPILWNTPAERGGGQDKAVETYVKGLKIARSKKAVAADPLEPSWGEPELLTNLAWSKLNQVVPDLDVAERDARAALGIIPYWHYVKDILLTQIAAAKAKLSGNSSNQNCIAPGLKFG